jgi:hypothetical protein
MYLVTYRDTNKAKDVQIKVSSMRSVTTVVNTLTARPWQYKNITFRKVVPTWFRDIVIILEA